MARPDPESDLASLLERRANGLLRVPFVRRCWLDFGDGREVSAFLVNINVLGAYVAEDDLPPVGQVACCRFALPESELELKVQAVVAWVNPRQQHPVHSLPPGYGLKFQDLGPLDRRRIEQVIADYVAARQPR